MRGGRREEAIRGGRRERGEFDTSIRPHYKYLIAGAITLHVLAALMQRVITFVQLFVRTKSSSLSLFELFVTKRANDKETLKQTD